MMNRHVCIIASLILALLCVASYASPRYNITDLGGTTSRATAINNNGWVVGYGVGAPISTSQCDQAFIWKPGEGLSNIGAADFSYAYGINDNGQVVGSRMENAFIWSSNDGFTDLGGSAMATAVNNSGRAVGCSYPFPGSAYMWIGGQTKILNSGSNHEVGALGINDSGIAVGYRWRAEAMEDDPWAGYRPTYWSTPISSIVELPLLSGTKTGRATAVNNLNQIVGECDGWPCLWNNYQNPVKIGAGLPQAINNLGQVVGYGGNGALLWASETGTVCLNTVIDPSLGWNLKYAFDINDNGWIVGAGTINGQTHAFLLTPVPEPGSLLVLGSGLVGLLAFRRRNR